MKSLRNIVLSTVLAASFGCASTQPDYGSETNFLMFKAPSELSATYGTDLITIFYTDNDGDGTLSGLAEISTVSPREISKELAYSAFMNLKR